jgi:predicted  nucleic acid-binding Zn-ribbon protein
MPITTFEDTQQMIRAYKKKKRELNKLKDSFFKMETEFMTIKQKNALMEEELIHTQKRCAKAEKALKQAQLKQQKQDSSALEKSLTLKTKEAEVFHKELNNQKLENQKLREKMRDILKRQGVSVQSVSSVGPALTQDDNSIKSCRKPDRHSFLRTRIQRTLRTSSSSRLCN